MAMPFSRSDSYETSSFFRPRQQFFHRAFPAPSGPAENTILARASTAAVYQFMPVYLWRRANPQDFAPLLIVAIDIYQTCADFIVGHMHRSDPHKSYPRIASSPSTSVSISSRKASLPARDDT